VKWLSLSPCVVCRHDVHGEVCYHHLISRGARKDLENEPWNKFSVCAKDHDAFHRKGINKMAEIPAVKIWLIQNGWLQDDMANWYHPGQVA